MVAPDGDVGDGGDGHGSPRPKPVSPSVLVNAVRATQAAGYTMTVGGTVDVQGQGFPISGRGQGGHIEVEVAGRRKVLDVSPARLLGYAPTTKAVEVTAGGVATVSFELGQSAIELTAVVTTGTGGSQVEARKLGSTVATIANRTTRMRTNAQRACVIEMLLIVPGTSPDAAF